MESPQPDVIQFLQSPRLKPFFKGGFETWASWIAVLKSIYAIPLDETELETFRRLTGRTGPDPDGYTVATLAFGRKSGKSTVCGIIGAYEALFGNHEENSSVIVLAPVMAQARIVFRSVKTFLDFFPGVIHKSSREEITLKNGITISIRAAVPAHLRGERIAAVIIDEFGGFQDDSQELIVALEPALVDQNSRMVFSSTVFGQCGPLWDSYQANFGKDTPSVFFLGKTRDLNPTFSQAKIDRAVASDPARFNAEYNGIWRDDISKLFGSRRTIDAICHADQTFPGPNDRLTYHGFVDVAQGGKSGDSMAIGIARMMYAKAEVVFLQEVKSPFDIEKTISEFSDILKRYRITTVKADKYAANFVTNSFSRHGIHVDHSVPSKSDLFLALYQHIQLDEAVLPANNETLKAQLLKLRRVLGTGNREKVDCPWGTRDDLANVCAGAIYEVFKFQAARLPCPEPVVIHKHITIREERKKALLESAEEMEQSMVDAIDRDFGGGCCVPLTPGRRTAFFPTREKP